jgi:hypothetical protein
MKALSFLSSSLLLATALSSCQRSEPVATPTWDNAHVASLHLQLVDPEYIQDITFSADGDATGTFGDKNGVTPAIVDWEIQHGLLVISSDQGVMDELSLVSESDEYIIARSKSGKMLRYRKLGR